MNTYQLQDKYGKVVAETTLDGDSDALSWARDEIRNHDQTLTLARVYPWGGCVRLMVYKRLSV